MSMRAGLIALLLATCISSQMSQAAAASCEAEIAEASKAYDIPVGILYSVGLTETGMRGSLQPFALNVEGKAYFARSKSEAVEVLNDALAQGKVLVDLGCMQINHHYHRDQFASVDAMLDPHANVRYAARFLHELKGRHESWTMAVARYHAGPNNDPAQKRYVCRVISNLVATGYGQWTPGARAFCT
jgi:soluble lytic murein transglycosylase-like protein